MRAGEGKEVIDLRKLERNCDLRALFWTPSRPVSFRRHILPLLVPTSRLDPTHLFRPLSAIIFSLPLPSLCLPPFYNVLFPFPPQFLPHSPHRLFSCPFTPFNNYRFLSFFYSLSHFFLTCVASPSFSIPLAHFLPYIFLFSSSSLLFPANFHSFANSFFLLPFLFFPVFLLFAFSFRRHLSYCFAAALGELMFLRYWFCPDLFSLHQCKTNSVLVKHLIGFSPTPLS